MRQIGLLSSESHAGRFVDFLTTQGIIAQAEEEQGSWSIWVRDENQVDSARQELEQFEQSPEDTRYRDVQRQAASIRQQQVKKQRETQKNLVQMRQQWNRPISQRAPLVLTLIVLCVGASIFSGFGAQTNVVTRSLMIVDPVAFQASGGDGLVNLRAGQFWRVITPIFLHGGVAHLVFNLFCLHYFGTEIESRRGTLRLALMVLTIAVCSNVAQFLAQGPFFLGISGVVYGLFGYMWMKTVRDPANGYPLSRQTVTMFMIILVLGFAGVFEHLGIHIANWTHGAGLVAGVAIVLGSEWLPPRTPAS